MDYLQKIEQGLDAWFSRARGAYDPLREAMRYSLLAGGKRIRPRLTLMFCAACHGDIDAALPVALGLEMLHTYTLIHDDLPAMDNDALRRGKPTCHMVYGEAGAILAGDCLQAEAFRALLSAPLLPERRVACAQALAEAAGLDGVCGGQYMDVCLPPQSDEAFLKDLQQRKTGALIACACRMGVRAAGGDERCERAAIAYGEALGAAFQIRDDMLDEISETEKLGKPVHSDLEQGKTTFMTLYGAAGCQARIEELTEQAIQAVSALADGQNQAQVESLCTLSRQLAARDT